MAPLLDISAGQQPAHDQPGAIISVACPLGGWSTSIAPARTPRHTHAVYGSVFIARTAPDRVLVRTHRRRHVALYRIVQHLPCRVVPTRFISLGSEIVSKSKTIQQVRKVPLGEAIKFTPEELDKLAQVTSEDIIKAQELWNQVVPEKQKNVLNTKKPRKRNSVAQKGET